MGLDIYLRSDADDKIYTKEYIDQEKDLEHSLSRSFCEFMSRRDVINGEPELDQIGKIIKVDITPLYNMNNYWDETSVDAQLPFLKSDLEKEKFLLRVNTAREKLKGNLNSVLALINTLIERLSDVDLLQKLNIAEPFSFDSEYYFSDFKTDKGVFLVTDKNFGQDLRNFKSFLEYAKSRGATSVAFTYG